MKLIITIVEDTDSLEEAEDIYYSIDELWEIVTAKLDDKDYHPLLFSKEKEEEEKKQKQ